MQTAPPPQAPPAAPPPPAGPSLLVPAALGLLSATLTLASVTVPALGILTLPFSTAPLFYAGLTRNVRGAGLASAVALTAALVFTGIGGVAVLALLAVGPAMIVAWYANLSRPVDEADPDGPVEWFPLPEIMARLVIYVALAVLVVVALVGYDPDALSGQLSAAVGELLSEAARQNPDVILPAEERIETQAQLFARFLPAIMPAGLVLVLFTSLGVASLVARARNSQRRVRDDVPAQAGLPLPAAVVFGVAIGCLLIGLFTVAAMTVVGALGVAFGLVGLAVIHYLMRGRPSRTATLVLLYLGVILFTPLWIGLVALGLAETVFGLRARIAHRFNAPPKE